MHKYDIRDVWMALKIASGNFFTLMFLVWGLIFFDMLIDDIGINSVALVNPAVIFSVLVFFQSVIIYLANRKYYIDLETGFITFPRSDVENSIFAIILLFPYWNLMRTMTVHAKEVENIYIDTKRWSTTHKVPNGTNAKGKTKYRNETKKHVRYTLNIAGTFGSANLQFLERQKRDEVRNGIQQCVKQHTGKNVDRKVAEI